jgi:deoxyribonuclease-4
VPALLTELRAALHEDGPGPGRLRLVHANDTRDPCGSRRDRHENLGAGHLGAAPFAALLRDPAAGQVPFIIETPGPSAAHAQDVTLLRKLRAS